MSRKSPLKVLIADDSQPVVEVLMELITDPGRIEVVGTADSQAGAIESIARLKPDVVVLDLQLSGGSGTEVIRAVRSSKELDGIQIMVISNNTSPQMRAGCLELGANEYFDKVKDLPALAAKLAALAA